METNFEARQTLDKVLKASRLINCPFQNRDEYMNCAAKIACLELALSQKNVELPPREKTYEIALERRNTLNPQREHVEAMKGRIEALVTSFEAHGGKVKRTTAPKRRFGIPKAPWWNLNQQK